MAHLLDGSKASRWADGTTCDAYAEAFSEQLMPLSVQGTDIHRVGLSGVLPLLAGVTGIVDWSRMKTRCFISEEEYCNKCL